MNDTLALATGLAAALGGGLLIGLERERRKGRGARREAAGIRSFTLAALGGGIAQALAQPALVPWAPPWWARWWRWPTSPAAAHKHQAMRQAMRQTQRRGSHPPTRG